ncbi:MAG: hypothetical protein ACLFWH_15150 [Actinomycetota bacterium]
MAPKAPAPGIRGQWALEQAERHLGTTIEAFGETAGQLANPTDPELWIFAGVNDDRRGATVTYAVEVDAAFLGYSPGPGLSVFEKWVAGEKVDERHHGPDVHEGPAHGVIANAAELMRWFGKGSTDG